jgi:L-ribulose-5-phosphate 3-epimerase
LKAINYTGCFLVEMWTDKAPDPVAEVSKAREWVLARMQEGGLF